MSRDERTGTRPGESGILSSFGFLLAAQVIGAGLGLMFWIVVARLVPEREVGYAAAAISTQLLLGTLTTLGLGTLFISELPLVGARGQRRLVLRGLGVATVASVAVGAVVLALRPFIGGSFGQALADPFGAGLFVAGIAGAATCAVIDQASLGLKRARLQVMRNLIASGLRFPLVLALLLAGDRNSTLLQASWVVPLFISLAVSWWRLRLGRAASEQRELDEQAGTTGPDRTTLRADLSSYAGPALRNHALNMAVTAASQLMPVIAGLVLLGAENASFAIAWQIASFVFLPPFLLATALFAHGANSSVAAFRATMRSTVPAGLVLSLALCVGAWTLGRPVMAVFGGHYAENATVILALLVPAGLWMVVKDHLVVLWRTQRRFATGISLSSIAVVIEVVGATIGGLIGGADGLCLGWLAGTVVGIVVFVPWLREGFGGLRFRWPFSREALRLLRDSGSELGEPVTSEPGPPPSP